ncbi:MAG TPA: choice-of-anchor tandem repeat GloVer-containing protein, partial [Candidatus Eisenbacteria bacterium]|nr:choice-of-anchor tandem repeat GloVer-containing protein [Candidatus Eisenbacteria bacterium]
MMKPGFFSMLLVALSAGLPLVAGAQVVTNLHLFAAGVTNGDRPNAGLIQGSDGNFYGTTQFGGSATMGTVFRISP